MEVNEEVLDENGVPQKVVREVVTINVSYNPFFPELGLRFLGVIAQEQGFEVENEIREDFVSQSFEKSNSLVLEDGTVQGGLFQLSETERFKFSDGAIGNYSFSIKSQAGVTFNEDLIFAGVFNSFKLNETYTSIKDDYIDKLSFNGKELSTELTAAINQFVAGEVTYEAVTAALLKGNDKIIAESGFNQINGYLGNDVLISGRGEDTFHFSTELNALTNLDKINKF